MTIYRLSQRLAFPPVDRAGPDGLLAQGGDLSVERLLLAYRSGIFPWYEEGYPILWWSPDPRFLLLPGTMNVSRSMRRVIRKGAFTVTYDRCFRDVMDACAHIPRRGARGTWITSDMADAYGRLHDAGYAHSVEVWREGHLAGGLYGVSIGKCFFGESMFSKVSDASKFALIMLAGQLERRAFHFIDCQLQTEHLERMGGEFVTRRRFLAMLADALVGDTLRGSWRDIFVEPSTTSRPASRSSP